MSAVEYEVRDRIGYARLNRPKVLNAIDEEMLSALAGLLEAVAGDEDVKALVFTGAGDAFCVGLDLGLLDRAFADTTYFRDVLVRFKRLLLGLEALPVPVVAAVNGTTRAGGFEIMLACDLVLVADEARIGDTHLAYGIVPGGGSTQRLPRLVGPQRARDLIYSGRWIDGCAAAEGGLALRSVPLAELGAALEELVGGFRTRSRPALAATKAAMRAGASLPLEAGLALEIDQLITYLETEPTAAEGFNAFIQRREPRWP